jgi:pyruvate,water dikinase
MTAVPLVEARNEPVFGGKAVQLGAGIRAGLPVPDGFALSADLVAAIARVERTAHPQLAPICAQLGDTLAVRSSAVGEDSAAASFAGQHTTVLNVSGLDAVLRAVAAVWQSGSSESALAYRRRVGADAGVHVGVVVQRLIPAEVAGVMFTHNPITGADEILIEASWGLGEAIVQGLVIPDSYRLSSGGELVDQVAGHKQLAARPRPTGETHHEPVDADLVEQPCLADAELRALHRLAVLCDEVFGEEPHDIEFAFAAGALYLLQRRPVTAPPAPSDG